MKKILLSILTLPLITLAAQAQKMYARVGIGYAMPAAGQTMNPATDAPYGGYITFVRNSSGNLDRTNYETKRASYNTGIQGHLGIGYMFTKNIGADLGITTSLAHTIYESYAQFPLGTTNVTQSFKTYTSNLLLFTPAMVLQSGGDKVNVYTRIGLTIPARTTITNEIIETQSMASNPSSASVTEEITHKFGLGFSGAAGVKYRLGRYMHLMVEVNGTALSMYTKKSEWTEYILNARSVPLSKIPLDIREVNYSDKGGSNTEPTYASPFSNIGITAGISINLF